jgi:hypothetical protein
MKRSALTLLLVLAAGQALAGDRAFERLDAETQSALSRLR